jgi:hypothetical protein
LINNTKNSKVIVAKVFNYDKLLLL